MSTTALPFRKALAANSTNSSFAAKNATTTKPSGNGIFDLVNLNLHVNRQGMSKFVQLLPFGTDGDNDTFDVQLWGWNPTNDTTVLWIPQLLVELNVTLCSATQGDTNAYLADTIALAKGDPEVKIVSPANNYTASALVHTRGCELIEFVFDYDAGAQASAGANCYWRVMDQS